MIKALLKTSCLLFFSIHLFASNQCFLVKENNAIIQQEGDCKERYSPCSTFKIPLALIGFDSEILKDETHPVWQFKKGYPDYIEAWKQPHNPTLWLKNSCVWYSQVLTKKLGMNKFKDYIVKLDYGNQDISGDKGKKNGLTNAWLSSSLEISPEEQMAFLEKFIANKLPVSAKAHEKTKNIMFIEDLTKGWKLYGKTGSGSLLSSDRTKKLELQHGWFIGWLKKNNRAVIFTYHIIDQEKQETYAGPRAREIAKAKLLKLIDQLET